jgi:hypothetical protein
VSYLLELECLHPMVLEILPSKGDLHMRDLGDSIDRICVHSRAASSEVVQELLNT